MFFCFLLLILTQSGCVKVVFSWNFRCSLKETVILLLSWSTLYRAFSKCLVSWIYFLSFNLLLVTESVCIKVIYFWNFTFSVKAVTLILLWSTLYINRRSNSIEFSLEHPVNSNVKVEEIINHVCWFWLSLPK